MKKITFILFALIAGTGFAQGTSDEDSGIATVNAEIVSPISIEDGSDLDFGRIIGNEDGGTVTVSTAGARTGDNDLLDPTNEGQAASFDITAADTYNYSIAIPDITLTGDGDNMAVNFDSSLGNASVGEGAVQTLNVGGDLTVNASQAEGAYTGEVTVTVAYE